MLRSCQSVRMCGIVFICKQIVFICKRLARSMCTWGFLYAREVLNLKIRSWTFSSAHTGLQKKRNDRRPVSLRGDCLEYSVIILRRHKVVHLHDSTIYRAVIYNVALTPSTAMKFRPKFFWPNPANPLHFRAFWKNYSGIVYITMPVQILFFSRS